MNDDKVTVEPPINDKIGPKFGIDWLTNKTAINTHKRIMTRLILILSIHIFVFIFIIR